MGKKKKEETTARLVDIARAAGVSITAAGSVLNVRTRPSSISPQVAAHIRQVAQQLNYIPNYHARSIRVGRADTIAVAVDYGYIHHDEPIEPFHPYWAHLLGAIDNICRRNGFQMTIVGPDEFRSAPDRSLFGIQQKRFDGMIIFGNVLHQGRTTLLSNPPPNLAMVVLQPSEPTVLPTIDFNVSAGIELAVKHLAQLGHRSVLWANPDWKDFDANRLPLFMQAAAKYQIIGHALPKNIVGPDAKNPVEPMMHHRTARIFKQYLDQPHPPFTAVACFNDEVALGVYEALAAANLSVPRDVSVIGFDDTIAHLGIPPLTTISHRFLKMGEEAARMVLNMVEDPHCREKYAGKRITVEPELILRSSTAQNLSRD